MRILLLNQCFYPDVAAVAQYLTDLGGALASRGHYVTAVCSRRGYDNPQIKYPKRETWKNVEILRVPVLALGKKAKWRRILNFLSFWVTCTLRLLFLPRQDVVVVSTAPPLLPVLAAVFVKLRGGRLVLWGMDLNPDEAIAAGLLREGSLAGRILCWMSLFSMREADSVVVLDRFMKDRLVSKGLSEARLAVIPPWSQDDDVAFDPAKRRSFRKRHGWQSHFVVMYSGNHSPCHPLDPLLQAAERLAGRRDIVFCFVGGGSEFPKVQRFAANHGLSNIVCLPYQPLGELSDLLSAADLHVVVMGDPFVGIIHPCKIYNILAVNSPFLYIGPAEGHVPDLRREHSLDQLFRHAQSGDVEAVVSAIVQSCAEPANRPRDSHSRAAIAKGTLLPKLVKLIEFSPAQEAAEVLDAQLLGRDRVR
jgi:colanic acid biosynthesis glycosyl transferase WcaI